MNINLAKSELEHLQKVACNITITGAIRPTPTKVFKMFDQSPLGTGYNGEVKGQISEPPVNLNKRYRTVARERDSYRPNRELPLQ